MTAKTAMFLIVDDEPDMCWAFEHIVESVGMTARSALSGGKALELLRRDSYQMAFLDAKLPDIDGLELAKKIRRLDPSIRLVVVSGYFYQNDPMVETALQEKRIDGFVSKPFKNDEILRIIRSVSQLPASSGDMGNPFR
jgi:DNA-binding NtrC family response regulator